MVYLHSSSGYRPLAILRNEVGETLAPDVMSNALSKGSEWHTDMTCWLAVKGGGKVITEPHWYGDKHSPEGGDAAIMKGINAVLRDVAMMNIKGYIVPDRG